jgi:(p)ppGpp synthase/HD superfamily hydrolase
MERLTESEVRDVAAALHATQVDKAGRPYFKHLERVVCILKDRWPDASPDEIAAAWLHDAIEDTGATPESLLAIGVSPESVRIVQAVTRPNGSIYLDWIADMAANGDRSVLRVKLADNQDNRDPARVAVLSGAAERVAERYMPARRLLEEGLAKLSESEPNPGL